MLLRFTSVMRICSGTGREAVEYSCLCRLTRKRESTGFCQKSLSWRSFRASTFIVIGRKIAMLVLERLGWGGSKAGKFGRDCRQEAVHFLTEATIDEREADVGCSCGSYCILSGRGSCAGQSQGAVGRSYGTGRDWRPEEGGGAVQEYSGIQGAARRSADSRDAVHHGIAGRRV